MVVIAVTGMPGAGSSTISKMLAKKLKIDYFSPGEYFKSHSNAETQTDQTLNVFKSGKGRQKTFHSKIDQMQIDLAKKGNIIICGKLSIMMLKNIADHKVWLECSIDERAKRTAERDKISFEESKEKVIEREGIEVKEWKKDYGIDYRKQKKMADIIIDTSKLNENKTLELILRKMKTRK